MTSRAGTRAADGVTPAISQGDANRSLEGSAPSSRLSCEGLLPLSPVVASEEEMAAYADEFDFVFGADEILNIAVSGPYGAGKSTVVETWEKSAKGSEHDFLHIELAHFQDRSGEDRVPAMSGPMAQEEPGSSAKLDSGMGRAHNAAHPRTDTRDLEVEILNQLIHKTDASKAPKNRFKRTKDRSGSEDTRLALCVVAFLALTMLLLWLSPMYSPVNWGTSQLWITLLLCAPVAAWLAFVFFAVRWLVKTNFLSKTVKKLKFFDTELEVADAGDGSAFNRSMDDLLYLLNCSGCDVVVFEDLDRFGRVDIFEKLRTINSLANRNRSEDDKPLRFMYLIHDGLFADPHDRTKFFDYIIPVIPYVDTNNSFEVLKRGLRAIGVDAGDQFLHGLSVFIDDPRILNAIVDETYHYLNALFDDDAGTKDLERLIAIIAYKEVFPRDFENLLVRRGYLHALLGSRKRLMGLAEENATQRRRELQGRLDVIKSANEYNEKELGLLFLANRSASFTPSIVYANGRQVRFDQLGTPKEVIGMIEGNAEAKRKFESQLASLASNAEYSARLAEIQGRADRESARLQEELNDLDARLVELRRSPLKDLLETVGERGFSAAPEGVRLQADSAEHEGPRFADVVGSPYFGLVRYLVLHGYIDESYGKYTSRFYPESLTVRDRDFVAAILQGSPTDPEYEVERPGAVVLKLDDVALGRGASRNYSLLAELIQYGDGKCAAFFRGLEVDGDLAFLARFVASGHYDKRVFRLMEDLLPHSVSAILGYAFPIEASVSRAYAQRLLADGGVLLGTEEVSRALQQASSADREFLVSPAADPVRMVEGMKVVGYRPRSLELESADEALARFVFDNLLFEPNAHLVKGLLENCLDDRRVVPIEELPEAVCERGENDALAKYVEAHMDVFSETLIDEASHNVEAIAVSEKAACWMLNAEAVDADLATEIARALRGRPVRTASIVADFSKRSALFEHDKVVASASNIIEFYRDGGFKITEPLAGFMNRNRVPDDLTLQLASELLGESNAFMDDLIVSDVEPGKLGEVACVYGKRYEVFTIDGLPSAKVTALIDSAAIAVNAENMQFFRRYYPALKGDLAASDASAYIALVLQDGEGESALPYDSEEAAALFENPAIAVEAKISLAEESPSPIPLNEGYPDELLAYICGSKLDKGDLTALPRCYSEGNAALKAAAVRSIASNLQEVELVDVGLPWDMLEDALALLTDEGRRSESVKLIAWKLDRTDAGADIRDDANRCFSAAKLEEYAKLLEGPSSTVPNKPEDLSLVNALMEKDLCSDKHPKPVGGDMLLVYSRGYTTKHR